MNSRWDLTFSLTSSWNEPERYFSPTPSPPPTLPRSYHAVIYFKTHLRRSHNAEMAPLRLWSDLIARRYSRRNFSPAHLAFSSVVNVVRGSIFFNLTSANKVRTPLPEWAVQTRFQTRGGRGGGGGAAAAAYAIDCRFPRVPNHNGVVAFHIMFIITTVTAH